MSLFVGNVSKKVSMQEFENAFKFYGTCKIDLRVTSDTYRKVLPLFNLRVRDALKRLNKLYRMKTSVD